jgi:iron(III) transport system ATP-binding protein
MVAVRVEGLVKRYGTALAVDGVSFTVEDGAFVTLLGPSGCGKTTTLRCVAGLERPEAGSVRIGDSLVCGPGIFVPIHRRQIGMVFQSYAIWPHMTAADNVRFPLRLRRVPRAEAQQRVQRALDLVDLGQLGERYPYQLSGGQQQRVALARALVYDPRVLLLDEPLSNLDAKLREQMRHELRAVQRRIGVTTIYVTHDQAEAMELSDDIVVMNAGRIEQIGDAIEIYRRPRTPFVRSFVGLVNELPGTVETSDGQHARIRVGSAWLDALTGEASAVRPGQSVRLWIRPEDVVLTRHSPPDDQNVLPARVARVVYQGSSVEYWLEVGTTSQIRAVAANHDVLAEDVTVACQLPLERLRLAESEPDPS